MNLSLEDWNQEDLQPLDIKSPPFWNEYDNYVLGGGKLEYSEWMALRDKSVFESLEVDQ